jgi:RND family efflux transporter MFP subunit
MNCYRPVSYFVATAILLLSLSACKQEKAEPRGAEPPVVTVSYPVIKPVVDYRSYVVRELGGEESVEIRARVSGYLEKTDFKPGAEVKVGDELFVIDQRPFIADLEKAKSEVSLYEARLIRAKADLDRAQQLIDSKSISKEDFDKMVGNKAETEASLEGAKAARQQAQNNLDFTVIKAPVNGRISRDLLSKGNLVRADDTLLTTIVDSSYIYAYFDMDEPTLLQLIRERIEDAKQDEVDAKEVEKLDKSKVRNNLSEVPVKMRVGNDANFAFTGHLDFIDNQINLSTGTIPIRAKFENPKQIGDMRLLVVGGHGDVSIPVTDEYKAMLVPAEAIQFDQSREVLYTVNDKNVVVTKPVKTGEAHDGMRVIREGIQPTDRVIVDGFMRVRQGATVTPKTVEELAAPKKAEAGK